MGEGCLRLGFGESVRGRGRSMRAPGHSAWGGGERSGDIEEDCGLDGGPVDD